jgi:micrococcal nuclease
LRVGPTSTVQTGSFYRPPGWDGTSDVNCKDFDTHAHAQSFFKGTGGSTTNDPYALDGDHDGTACETLH